MRSTILAILPSIGFLLACSGLLEPRATLAVFPNQSLTFSGSMLADSEGTLSGEVRPHSLFDRHTVEDVGGAWGDATTGISVDVLDAVFVTDELGVLKLQGTRTFFGGQDTASFSLQFDPAQPAGLLEHCGEPIEGHLEFTWQTVLVTGPLDDVSPQTSGDIESEKGTIQLRCLK